MGDVGMFKKTSKIMCTQLFYKPPKISIDFLPAFGSPKMMDLLFDVVQYKFSNTYLYHIGRLAWDTLTHK